MPIYFGKNIFASNDTVENVYIDAFGDPNYADIVGGDVATPIAEPEHLFPTTSNESEGITVMQATPATFRAAPSRADEWARPADRAAAAPRIEWFRGRFSQAAQVAQALDRPLLVFLYAGDDPQSIALHRRFFGATAVRTVAAGLVCFAADVRRPRGQQLVEQFDVLLTPALLLYQPGTEQARTVVAEPAAFAAAVAAARETHR